VALQQLAVLFVTCNALSPYHHPLLRHIQRIYLLPTASGTEGSTSSPAFPLNGLLLVVSRDTHTPQQSIHNHRPVSNSASAMPCPSQTIFERTNFSSRPLASQWQPAQVPLAFVTVASQRNHWQSLISYKANCSSD
jgi:hypothetical protein